MTEEISRIVVASSAFERRVKRCAPTAYCYFVIGSEAARWGYASERDTQLMTGRAITRAINDVYLENPDARVEIIAEKPGFEKFFNEYLPIWIAEDRIGQKHGGYEWKEAHLFQLISNAKIRRPISHEEKRIVRAVTDKARNVVREVAKEAFVRDPSLYDRIGTILTDECPGAPALPMRIE